MIMFKNDSCRWQATPFWTPCLKAMIEGLQLNYILPGTTRLILCCCFCLFLTGIPYLMNNGVKATD